MSGSAWVHLNVIKIHKETASAFLCEIGESREDAVMEWIPKSQCADPDDYEEGDENLTLSVTQWIADQKGLV